MTEKQRALRHYEGLAAEAARDAERAAVLGRAMDTLFVRRDPGMAVPPERLALIRANLPIDSEGKAIVENPDA